MGVTASKFIAENGAGNQHVQFCCYQSRKNHSRILSACHSHSNGSQLDSGMVLRGKNNGVVDKSPLTSSYGFKECQFGNQTLDHNQKFPPGWTEGQWYKLSWAVQCSRRTFRSKAPLKFVAIQVIFTLDSNFSYFCFLLPLCNRLLP